MAFAAPTYGASYDQTEQNDNAVLIAAGINLGGTNDAELRAAILLAATKTNLALDAILSRRVDVNADCVSAVNVAKAANAALIVEATAP